MRIATAVRLRARATGTLFTYLNTHLDDQSDAQRRLGASLILWRARFEAAQGGSGRGLVLVTGDFNRYAPCPFCRAPSVLAFAQLSVASDLTWLTLLGRTQSVDGYRLGRVQYHHRRAAPRRDQPDIRRPLPDSKQCPAEFHGHRPAHARVAVRRIGQLRDVHRLRRPPGRKPVHAHRLCIWGQQRRLVRGLFSCPVEALFFSVLFCCREPAVWLCSAFVLPFRHSTGSIRQACLISALETAPAGVFFSLHTCVRIRARRSFSLLLPSYIPRPLAENPHLPWPGVMPRLYAVLASPTLHSPFLRFTTSRLVWARLSSPFPSPILMHGTT